MCVWLCVEGITTTDDFRDVIESSLRKVETKKKREIKRNQKLSEELKRAQEENEELRNRLNWLEIILLLWSQGL